MVCAGTELVGGNATPGTGTARSRARAGRFTRQVHFEFRPPCGDSGVAIVAIVVAITSNTSWDQALRRVFLECSVSLCSLVLFSNLNLRVLVREV